MAMIAIGIPGLDLPTPGKMADWLDEHRINALKKVIELLAHHSHPTIGMITSDWFGFLVGSWFGLARQLLVITVMAIFLMVTLRPMSDHGRNISKVMTSFVGLFIFAQVFYPLYRFAAGLSEAVSRALIEGLVLKGEKGDVADKLSALTMPGDISGKIAALAVSIPFFLALWAIALGLNISVIGFASIYPLAIVSRPFHLGERLYHMANGMIVVGLSSGPIMTFWLCIGYWLGGQLVLQIPGYQTSIQVGIQIASSLLAIASPMVLFLGVYKTSKEVWGKVDSAMRGAMSISGSTPLTVHMANQEIQDDRKSGFAKEVISSAVTASMDDKRGEPVSRRLLDIAGTAATATGYPVAAIAFQAAKARVPEVNQTVEGGDVK
jgi:hypothetical protein